MLLKKDFPEEDDLVFCIVTKIQYNCVFVNIDDYNRSGMIHISEISPGRIRNIRDYVKEGKKVVCKVLRINKERGHIDLSLRRVTESQRRNKVSGVQQEQKAKKILEIIAKDLNIESKKIHEEVSEKILKTYPNIHTCFIDVANDKFNLDKLGLDNRIAKSLTELIKQRIKPKEIEISGYLTLKSYKPEGVNDIKSILKKIEQKNIKVLYEGAGKYKIIVVSDDYKKAEKILGKTEDNITNYINEFDCEGEFTR